MHYLINYEQLLFSRCKGKNNLIKIVEMLIKKQGFPISRKPLKPKLYLFYSLMDGRIS